MRFSNIGRIPDYVFGDKENLEKTAQIGYASSVEPKNFIEYMKYLADVANTNRESALAIANDLRDVYAIYETTDGVVAPENIGNPVDLAMSLAEKLSIELSKLARFGEKFASIEKRAQWDDEREDYYDDIEDLGNREGWEDAQAEIESAWEESRMEPTTDVDEDSYDPKTELVFAELSEEYSGGTVQYDDFAIVPEGDGRAWLWGYGEYLPGSVLSGQFARGRLEPFESIEEAKEAFPYVPVDSDPELPSSMFPGPSEMPPKDFDPMDAGEVWSEDGY